MNNAFSVFETFSVATGIGAAVLGLSGQARFASSVWAGLFGTMESLLSALDCAETEPMALVYGFYQARRFGGRYIFFAPSGLVYCASPLINSRGEMLSGVVAGPFMMTDHDEYLSIDVLRRQAFDPRDTESIQRQIREIPAKTPAQAGAIGELLHLCAARFSDAAELTYAPHGDVLAAAYPLDKEDELLTAVSRGDVQSASALLNDILGQVLFHSGSDFELLRVRVFELTVLLSRAVLKGGANIDAIFGLNYGYLREIDALSSTEDIIQWLHGVTRRFARHVFDFAGAKHADVIYKAVAYMRRHYAQKITLADIADHVLLSPTYFSKVFKLETGQTPCNFLTGVRIDASKRLLRDPSVQLVDVPEMVGFDNQSYFTKVFKKAESRTPGRYRQQTIEREHRD